MNPHFPIYYFFYLLVGIIVCISTNTHAQCYNGNPNADFSGYNNALSIEANFNSARRWEEGKLGLAPNCLGNLVAPTGGWASLSDTERALYIIQAERVARNRLPYQGMETNLNTVAAAHSQWLHANNKFAHTGNSAQGTSCSDPQLAPCAPAFTGSCFFQRINANPNLNGCSQTSSENIGVVTGNQDVVAVSIYGMMYVDLACCAWGHRNGFLAIYSNDYGPSNSEGFIGIGIHEGPGYQWPFANMPCPTYYAKLITFNMYDPSTFGGCNFSPINGGGVETCPDELPLTGTINTGNHQAKEITANGIIQASNIVTFQAEQQIVLTNGFRVFSRGTFTASIGPCSNLTAENTPITSRNKEEKLVRFGQPVSYTPIEFQGVITPNKENQLDIVNTTTSLQLFPNPMDAIFKIAIQLSNSETTAQIDIYDVTGKLMSSPLKQQTIHSRQQIIEVNGQNWESGIYFVRLTTKEQIITRKLFK